METRAFLVSHETTDAYFNPTIDTIFILRSGHKNPLLVHHCFELISETINTDGVMDKELVVRIKTTGKFMMYILSTNEEGRARRACRV